MVIVVHQAREGRWRFSYTWAGRRHHVARVSRQAAIDEARRIARQIAEGQVAADQVDASELAEFRAWKASRSRSLERVAWEFLAAKERSAGASGRNVQTLRQHVERAVEALGRSRPLGEIQTVELEQWIDGLGVAPRSRNNIRNSMVTLWRWAKAREYVPDRLTAAEKVERWREVRGAVAILTPDQLAVCFEAVRPDYLPWLALGGLAGIRMEEMAPSSLSSKPALRWESIYLERRLVEVPAETSKTGRRRLVPVGDSLAAWLERCRPAAGGRVCPVTPPTKRETGRLGEAIGGWPTNGLRHSFGSYRTAVLGDPARVSLEMGNSAAVVMRHYFEAVTPEDGRAWFAVAPGS